MRLLATGARRMFAAALEAEAAQARWRSVNAPHLVALVRSDARLERDRLVERPKAAAA
ncbi:hypothetical protein ACFQZ8_10040 [Micromonospora azadirachtae]|uniref:Uncharacterized protein n=1 Tax=Micromonospora azadirachtae TaxID=1970735 RepID=A0ABW3A0P5_9ACTN